MQTQQPLRLPHEDNLIRLAHMVTFPTTRRSLISTALKKHYALSTVAFLQLFGQDDVFENELDFVTQCEELKLMIRENRAAPPELLKSPQG